MSSCRSDPKEREAFLGAEAHGAKAAANRLCLCALVALLCAIGVSAAVRIEPRSLAAVGISTFRVPAFVSTTGNARSTARVWPSLISDAWIALHD